MKLAAAAPVGQDRTLSLEVSRVMATCIAATMSDLRPFEIGCHWGYVLVLDVTLREQKEPSRIPETVTRRSTGSPQRPARRDVAPVHKGAWQRPLVEVGTQCHTQCH